MPFSIKFLKSKQFFKILEIFFLFFFKKIKFIYYFLLQMTFHSKNVIFLLFLLMFMSYFACFLKILLPLFKDLPLHKPSISQNSFSFYYKISLNLSFAPISYKKTTISRKKLIKECDNEKDLVAFTFFFIICAFDFYFFLQIVYLQFIFHINNCLSVQKIA